VPTVLEPTPPSSKTNPAVRTELHAQLTEQIPSIQALLLHLEGKGRSENTRIAYEKNLKALAIRADLKDTKTVELAIARYKKKDGTPITRADVGIEKVGEGFDCYASIFFFCSGQT